ncbi:hypothetical protein D3C75_1052070 [compost metagenome]
MISFDHRHGQISGQNAAPLQTGFQLIREKREVNNSLHSLFHVDRRIYIHHRRIHLHQIRPMIIRRKIIAYGLGNRQRDWLAVNGFWQQLFRPQTLQRLIHLIHLERQCNLL